MACSIRESIVTFFAVALGFIIRLLGLTFFKESIRQRVEVTTPIGSWKRAQEGVHLWTSGYNPYLGNVFHEYPISLQFYKIIISYFNEDVVFAAVDSLTGIILHYSVYHQKLIMPSKITTEEKSEAIVEEAKLSSFRVLIIYLLSPLTILSCSGLSTSIFTNFLLSLIMFILPMKPFKTLTCVICAFLACNNLHYTALILPIFLCLEYIHSENKDSQEPELKASARNDKNQSKPRFFSLAYHQESNFYSKLSTSATIFIVTLMSLSIISYLLMGRTWNFLESSYLFVLKVQDQTPNIGMSWYFFTEVFETFSDFFAWTAQINAFIHVIPLSITLRDEPFFLLYINIVTTTIFQPYPSLSSIGLVTSLLPQWSYLFEHTRKGLIVICGGVVCLSLCPVFWHLWIVMGTANSNFYFGVTLAFTVSLILFLNDLLNAYTYYTVKAKFGLLKTKTMDTSANIDNKKII